MKKAIKLILPLFIVGMLLGTCASEAASFGVTVGDTFTYECVDAYQNIVAGSNSASVNTFELGGGEYGAGDSLNVEVTAVSSTEVSYNASIGVDEETGSSNINELDFLVASVIIPLLYPIVILGNPSTWDQAMMEEPFVFLLIPFVETDATAWDSIKDTVYDINHQTIDTTDTNTDSGEIVMNATYTESNDIFYFEFYGQGTFDSTYTLSSATALAQYSFEHRVQLSYTVSTGVMNGLRMQGDLSGEVNNTAITMDYDFRTEKLGYDLPPYSLGSGWSWPFPGFGLYVTIGALASFAVIVLIIKKRK